MFAIASALEFGMNATSYVPRSRTRVREANEKLAKAITRAVTELSIVSEYQGV